LEDVEAEYLIELFLNWQNKNDFESFQLLEVKEKKIDLTNLLLVC
jgi:hypothetical protein